MAKKQEEGFVIIDDDQPTRKGKGKPRKPREAKAAPLPLVALHGAQTAPNAPRSQLGRRSILAQSPEMLRQLKAIIDPNDAPPLALMARALKSGAPIAICFQYARIHHRTWYAWQERYENDPNCPAEIAEFVELVKAAQAEKCIEHLEHLENMASGEIKGNAQASIFFLERRFGDHFAPRPKETNKTDINVTVNQTSDIIQKANEAALNNAQTQEEFKRRLAQEEANKKAQGDEIIEVEVIPDEDDPEL